MLLSYIMFDNFLQFLFTEKANVMLAFQRYALGLGTHGTKKGHVH